MRLIDADALTEFFKARMALWLNVDEVLDVISDAPTISVEPVRRGKWTGRAIAHYYSGEPAFYEWECSECRCVVEDEEPRYKYCPYCGARMEVENG